MLDMWEHWESGKGGTTDKEGVELDLYNEERSVTV